MRLVLGMLAMLCVEPCAALQAGALQLRRAQGTRSATSIVMGEASTNKWNEWKFVKGVNDYGKEQTYMYLGAKDKADDGSSPLSKPVIDVLPEGWNFLLKPYFIMLFSPLVLATACLIFL